MTGAPSYGELITDEISMLDIGVVDPHVVAGRISAHMAPMRIWELDDLQEAVREAVRQDERYPVDICLPEDDVERLPDPERIERGLEHNTLVYMSGFYGQEENYDVEAMIEAFGAWQDSPLSEEHAAFVRNFAGTTMRNGDHHPDKVWARIELESYNDC